MDTMLQWGWKVNKYCDGRTLETVNNFWRQEDTDPFFIIQVLIMLTEVKYTLF
jgi:hypothetical protein